MSLMIGCHAEALTTELKVDRSELEDARWFAREEVAGMVLRKHPDGLTATHPFAIAHHIIRAWLRSDQSFSDMASIFAQVLRFSTSFFASARSDARYQGAGEQFITIGAATPPVPRSPSPGSAAKAYFAAPLALTRSQTASLKAWCEGVACVGCVGAPGARTPGVSDFRGCPWRSYHCELSRAVLTTPQWRINLLVAAVDAILADNRFPDFVLPICRAAWRAAFSGDRRR